MKEHEVEISVYENDSTDGTKKLLKQYTDRLLKRCKTTFTSTDLGTEHLVGQEGARVKNIANARNACLEQASPIEAFDKIVFIETDVLYKPDDALKLITTTETLYQDTQPMQWVNFTMLGQHENVGRDLVEPWDSIREG